MNLFFVFNPKSGQEKIKPMLGDIIELFSVKGHKITVAATTKRGDATEWVKNLEDGYDRVICSGGDGTLDEVVEGMRAREKALPIGYIPAGSTNDFASSVGIPSRMIKAAEVAIGDNIFDCDLGTFNGRSFVYVAAFGAFTEVSYGTPQELKNVLGHSAYVLEAIKHLVDIKPHHMKVITDDASIEGDFILGMITNSDSVGGIKNLTGKNISLDDGLFEVTLVSTLIKEPEINVEEGTKVDGPLRNVYTFKTSTIKFISEEAVSWTLDGEYGGDEKEVEIKNVRHALSIAVK